MKKTTLLVSSIVLSLNILFNPAVANAGESLASTQGIPSLAPMLQKVIPSVVSVYIQGTQNIPATQEFGQFFGDNSPFCMPGFPFNNTPFCGKNAQQQPRTQKFNALGSGVIIDAKKGYVITNNHVVQNASKITVKLNDGRKYDAKVIGKDPDTDLAVLQLIDAKNLTAIQMADSNKLRVGDFVVAIGNPYGLGETATSGIVSALGRSGLNTDNYENYIQTDAAINRGNSGGALVNLEGQLIGINTAILAPDGGNIGIGFAIPSDMAKNLTRQIIKYGQVKRGELGIVGTELTPELANAMKINAEKGAFVSQVVPGSAADKAGIKAGDVLVSSNGSPITSFTSFRAEIASLPVGSKLALGVLRQGKKLTVEAVLTQQHEMKIASGKISQGIDGAELSDSEANGQKGIKVDKVTPGSAAARIGLQKGDLILSINQHRTTDLGQLRQAVGNKNDTSVLALHILRNHADIYLLMQ